MIGCVVYVGIKVRPLSSREVSATVRVRLDRFIVKELVGLEVEVGKEETMIELEFSCLNDS
jgi:hypothetical protein